MVGLNEIAYELIKTVGVGFFGMIAWYARGIAKSVKLMEKDISLIKTAIEVSTVQHDQVVKRIDRVESELKEQTHRIDTLIHK